MPKRTESEIADFLQQLAPNLEADVEVYSSPPGACPAHAQEEQHAVDWPL